jgi:hypothetical protein
MHPIKRIELQEKTKDKYLSLINQNKSVDHIIRQFKMRPHTPMRTIKRHLDLTFGPFVNVAVATHDLTAVIDGIKLEIERHNRIINIRVDGTSIDSIIYK